jgi:GT2 family glycosyltransferase
MQLLHYVMNNEKLRWVAMPVESHPEMQESSDPSVAAVIVNWNQPELTAECIHSLLGQAGIEIQIILVDNGSSDGSTQILRQKFPDIQIQATHENLGFAMAANIGIRRSIKVGVRYILLMNNDAIADEHMVARLLEQRTSTTGILAPVIYHYEHPEKVWSIGGMLRPLIIERTDDAQRYDENKTSALAFLEKDFVTGCCMLIPDETFERVGMLDERFRMYYDDADFCYRVREHGYLIQVVPAAKAWHHIAASSEGKDTPNERYWMARSSVLFFRKHASGPKSILIFIYRAASAVKMGIRLLAKGNLRAFLAYFRGLKDGFQQAFA